MGGRVLSTSGISRIRKATVDNLLKEGIEVQLVVINNDKLEI